MILILEYFMKIIFLIILITNYIFAFDINFNNFSSNFIQIVTSNSTISYKGNLIITKDKAFWNYKSPNSKQIYINNDELIIIEPELEQVIMQKLINIPNLNQIFKNAKKQNNQELKATYNDIVYTISIKDDEIYSISYTDEFDNETIIVLDNQKRNTNIDDSIFKPNIPTHFDIIK